MYFWTWTNFGYTLCTKGIPMYKVRQWTYVIVSYLLPCVPSRSQAQQIDTIIENRDHGSSCPTSSIMQWHYHSSATAGPNPLKINDDKVNSSFYNSFQFQHRCFVFRWSRYYYNYVHPSSSAKHTSSSLPLQPLQTHQIRQNNIIFSYEAAYIRQNIMYTTMNQLMHQIQQSTNNMTIIHPWQSYKFSSTQLWSCCSAGSLSHTSQTAAAWLSPHITVVHVMVFKVFQEWFSSAKPWTTLMNDLICLNCDMDDLPRCLMSAAFNRRNDGHYSRSQYHI